MKNKEYRSVLRFIYFEERLQVAVLNKQYFSRDGKGFTDDFRRQSGNDERQVERQQAFKDNWHEFLTIISKAKKIPILQW